MPKREDLPEEYQTLDSKYGTPLLCVDNLPMSFAIEPYRRSVQADKENVSVRRLIEKETFWNEMVRDVADA